MKIWYQCYSLNNLKILWRKHSRLRTFLMIIQVQETKPTQDWSVCFKDSKNVLHEILANRVLLGSTANSGRFAKSGQSKRFVISEKRECITSKNVNYSATFKIAMCQFWRKILIEKIIFHWCSSHPWKIWICDWYLSLCWICYFNRRR